MAKPPVGATSVLGPAEMKGPSRWGRRDGRSTGEEKEGGPSPRGPSPARIKLTSSPAGVKREGRLHNSGDMATNLTPKERALLIAGKATMDPRTRAFHWQETADVIGMS